MIRTFLSLLPDGSRGSIANYFAITLAGIALRAAQAILLVPLAKALFGDEPADAWPWLGWLALATATGWLVDWYGAKLGYYIGFTLLDTGQRTVAQRITHIQLIWFTAKNVATTRQAVAATGPDLVGLVVNLLVPFLSALMLPALIAIALLTIAWQLTVAALTGMVVLFGAYIAASRLSREADLGAAHANSRLTERIVEFARTQQALRAARRVEIERSLVGKALAQQHSTLQTSLLRQIPGQVIFGIASQIALVTLAGVTAYLTVSDQISAAQAVALIIVIVRYLESFTVLAQLTPGFATTTKALRNIREVLTAPEISSGQESIVNDHLPTVEMRAVTFGYQPGINVIENFSVRFHPGSTTAIVGLSGSGKSTILSLLAGLYEPSSGEILVDGIEIRKLSLTQRRELVTAVFQDPYLFDGSIRDNVLAGNPNATDEQFQAAIEFARVDHIVASATDGWLTRVGEGGSSLSGGERQRVALARAVINPAPILLIDEATSSLDTQNEEAITAALAADPVARTRIIVTHRLSSIQNADRVIFLADGHIVEDGSVQELLAAQGRFADFWRQQHLAAQWRIGS